MAAILQKSNSNIVTAKTLYDAELFAPSAHAAYYGIFLLFRYILNRKNICSYLAQEALSDGQNSHKNIVNVLMDYLDDNTEDGSVDVQGAYDYLKRLRKKADYTSSEVTKTEVGKNFSKITDIKDILTPLNT